MLEDRRLLATFMVTNAGDDVTGGTPFQLRWAIDQVNAGPGTGDSITFSLGLSGTPQTIDLNAALPAITNPVSINGWSQNGGAPGVMIGINGGGLVGDGLTFNTYGSTIEGLAISGFNGNGVDLYGNGDSISNCYIGTDTSGTATGVGNTGNGVVITGTGDTISSPASGGSGNGNSGSSGSGGSGMGGMGGLGGSGSGGSSSGASGNNGSGSPGAGTVISDNGAQGVYVTGSSNLIQDSIIGLGADGETPLGNGGVGILLSSGASNNTIGAGNVISGNTGAGVTLSGSNVSGNEVVGDLIGTDATGEIAKQNGGDGIVIDAAPANTIGGTGTGEANVISGNAGNGIRIADGAEDNLVSVNLIGTDQAGAVALGNENDGVYVGSDNNTIGAWNGTSSGDGAPTVISGDYGAAEIDLAGDDNDVVNCYVGTDITGLVGLGNGMDGIKDEGSNNDIGLCFAPAPPTNVLAPPGTVISGKPANGITTTGKGGILADCFIGVGKDGTTPVPNGVDGVLMVGVGATGNTVSGNVISSNGQVGVYLAAGAANNVVQGNHIGTDKNGNGQLDVNGKNVLGNGSDGVSLEGTGQGNTIGGGAAGQGNVISGNRLSGVGIGGSGNLVQQNYIGTNAAGSGKLANGTSGIGLGGDNNTIGGGAAGQGNVISGNGWNGVSIGGSSNLVQGNYIGTDKTGTAALGNVENGINVTSSGNIIGGNESDGEGNVISANGGDGILLDVNASANFVQGNYIGTNVNGSGQMVNGMNVLGNGNDGILLEGFCNYIGGVVDSNNGIDERNIISGNSGDGIDINGGATNLVVGNWIGLDGTGAAPLGNLLDGVALTNNASGNTIGGANGAGNVISGNGSEPDATQDDGVFIGTGANNNYLWGNYIGTDATGLVAVGNWGDGVYVEVTADGGNEVGGASGLGNVISANGAGNGNTVSGYGIDLTLSTIEDYNIIGWDANGEVLGGKKLQNRLGGAPAGWTYGAHDNPTPL